MERHRAWGIGKKIDDRRRRTEDRRQLGTKNSFDRLTTSSHSAQRRLKILDWRLQIGDRQNRLNGFNDLNGLNGLRVCKKVTPSSSHFLTLSSLLPVFPALVLARSGSMGCRFQRLSASRSLLNFPSAPPTVYMRKESSVILLGVTFNIFDPMLTGQDD